MNIGLKSFQKISVDPHRYEGEFEILALPEVSLSLEYDTLCTEQTYMATVEPMQAVN